MPSTPVAEVCSNAALILLIESSIQADQLDPQLERGCLRDPPIVIRCRDIGEITSQQDANAAQLMARLPSVRRAALDLALRS